MKPWLTPLLLALLIGAAHHWRNELRHNLLGKTSSGAAEELRQEEAALVFQKGALADSKNQAREQLRQKHLIRQHRQQDLAFGAGADVQISLAAEMTAWKRQWPTAEDRQARLQAQGLTEAGMEHRIREALLDQAWIERQIADEIQVTDAELQASYQQQRQHLILPEGYRAAHLFLSRQGSNGKDRAAQMDGLRQRLTKGESWAALVGAHSEDPRTKTLAGDLGWTTDLRMPADFMAAVRKLKKGETSTTVSTALGWHLIRLLDRRPAREPTFAEMRAELQAALEGAKREAAMTKLKQRLAAP